MVTYDMNDFHIPDESKPKNIYFAFNCGICDKKIPKDNGYCYACRKEYQISREGIFKYNIQSHEKERRIHNAMIIAEDKSFPAYCQVCFKRKVKTGGGTCYVCLRFIMGEEE
jgi:hypothetical protein|tara:strand:+ start:284 stop:619 length:336 start_codon:yes stop_codon:yes gene_type:complete